jgi:hypothetical protein
VPVPVVGAGITVAIFRRWRDERPVLRRAYVVAVSPEQQSKRNHGACISWKSGSLVGEVWETTENIDWIHGHGPQARAALLAIRALRE